MAKIKTGEIFKKAMPAVFVPRSKSLLLKNYRNNRHLHQLKKD